MVKIRLTRLGDAHAPVYRVVVTDSRKAANGGAIENIGTYNPLTNPKQININKERAEYWLSVGAQPTDTAKQLLKQAGVEKASAAKAEKKAPAKKTTKKETK